MKKITYINKKGNSMISESDKMLFWFIILGVIALCMILIVSWTSNLKKLYSGDALAPSAYEARLIYSDKCFAYKDPDTGRVYTGVIDSLKFTQNTFYDCLPLEGISQHAISAGLQTQDGKTTFYVESPNWKKTTGDVSMRTYVVEVKDYGPGLLTIYHKEGE